jgi:hypothetical protein
MSMQEWQENGGKMEANLTCPISAVVNHIFPLRDNACMDIGHD